MKHLLSLFILLIGLAAWPVHAQEIVCPKPTANPEENKNEARRYYNMGNTYFNMKQYEKSAASFVCVINLVPYSIMARYRLALSYDQLGKYSLAREQLQWVLADASEEARPLHADAQKRLDAMKDLPDKGAAVVPPVKPPVDPAAEKAAREAAEKARLAAEAEKARIATENQKKAAAEKAARDAEARKKADAEKAARDAEARKKADAEKAARDAKSGAGEPTAPPKPKLTSRWWFWTGVGATVVFTGTAVGFGLLTLDARDRWESTWNPEDRSTLEDNRLFTDLALAGAVISAAALTVGILLSGSGAKKNDEKKTGWLLVPACGPEGCMMTFSLGF